MKKDGFSYNSADHFEYSYVFDDTRYIFRMWHEKGCRGVYGVEAWTVILFVDPTIIDDDVAGIQVRFSTDMNSIGFFSL